MIASPLQRSKKPHEATPIHVLPYLPQVSTHYPARSFSYLVGRQFHGPAFEVRDYGNKVTGRPIALSPAILAYAPLRQAYILHGYGAGYVSQRAESAFYAGRFQRGG